jgi:hypothetical protein
MRRFPECALQRRGCHQQENHGYHDEGGDGALGAELREEEGAERWPESESDQ